MANEYKNVLMSFEKRCVALLTTDQLIFGNQDVDTETVTAWMRCTYLGDEPNVARNTMRDERHRFQISCFAKTGTDDESEHKTLEMVDEVRAAFHQATFELKNWAGDDSLIDHITTGPVRHDIIDENNPEVTHRACQFTGLVIFNP